MARSLKPAGLPAIILFLMVRFNDVRANAAEIQTIMSTLERIVLDAPMQRHKRQSMMEVRSTPPPPLNEEKALYS